jgi:hypothetical protein
MSADDLHARLAEHGYTETDIGRLTQLLEPDLNMTSIERLVRYGEITQDQAIQLLQLTGWTQQYAQQRLRAEQLARVDRWVHEYIAQLLTDLKEGWIQPADIQATLPNLPLYPDEQTWLMKVVGYRAEYPRKRLTWPQVVQAYTLGAINLTDVDAWIEQSGYSAADQTVLELELLQKVSTSKTAKAAHSKYLTWANVKDAYKSGSIDLTYVNKWLAEEGFASPEAQIMITLLPAPPTPGTIVPVA